ncbi:centromere protein X-like protein [Zopfochytrium polystomum]|nr:centromere protein X-like protein [Zopfochytrium polystomum]
MNTAFSTELIQALVAYKTENNSVKINKDALLLAAEYLRVFTLEALSEAAEQAEKPGTSGNGRLMLAQLEKILPQLLLDFS